MLPPAPGCAGTVARQTSRGPPDLDTAGAARGKIAAGAAHVQSEHFKKARQWLPPHLAETPKIVNFEIPQDDWSRLGEMAVPEDS